MYDVIKNHPRPSQELLEAFSKLQPAAIHEAMGKRGALNSDIRPAWFGAHLCGSALTIKAAPGDNLMLHKAVSIAQPGDVLVVDMDGFTECGPWGEIITKAAMKAGITGIVTNGSVRDTEPIHDLGFPMFSRGCCMKGTTKMKAGKINNPIVIGNIQVNAGDIVVADNDGVVVVPLEEAEAVLKATQEKEAAEAKIMERVAAGECTMDILNIRATYEALGLTED